MPRHRDGSRGASGAPGSPPAGPPHHHLSILPWRTGLAPWRGSFEPQDKLAHNAGPRLLRLSSSENPDWAFPGVPKVLGRARPCRGDVARPAVSIRGDLGHAAHRGPCQAAGAGVYAAHVGSRTLATELLTYGETRAPSPSLSPSGPPLSRSPTNPGIWSSVADMRLAAKKPHMPPFPWSRAGAPRRASPLLRSPGRMILACRGRPGV